MGKSLFIEKMNLPSPDVIDECYSLREFPHFLVGDEAFPLRP